MSFFGKIFNRKDVPAFDLEKAVGQYLLSMPRPAKWITICCPKYDAAHYSCRVTVAARDLLPWAEQHLENVLSCDNEEQAVRTALPIWLRGANEKDCSLTPIPPVVFQVLRLYISDFIKSGLARTYCYYCESFINSVNMQTINRNQLGSWVSWEDVWTCPEGHQLYQEKSEMHLNIKPQ